MRLLGLGVVQKQKCLMRFSQTGNANTRQGWAGRPDGGGLEFSFADFALPQHSSSKLGSAFGLRKIRFLFFKKKEERKTHNPPKFRIFEA